MEHQDHKKQDTNLDQAYGENSNQENLLNKKEKPAAGEEMSFAYLDPLKKGRDPPSLKQMATLTAILIKDTILVASAYVGPFIFSAFIYRYLGETVDSRTQAAFGISNSYILVFFNSFMYSGMDKIGIALSQMLGSKDFEGYRQNFGKGIMSTWMISLGATLPLFLFSGFILKSIGIEEETAAIAQSYLRRVLPIVGMETISHLVRTFCVAQGHESLIGKIIFANTLVCIVIGYYLIVVQNQGLWGAVILKGIYEGVNLLIGATIMIAHKMVSS